MNQQAKYWTSICLKCDRQRSRHREKVDKLVRQGRKGKSTSSKINVVMVRQNPKSTITYADYGTKIRESDLPPPLAEAKDALIGIMWVNDEMYAKTQVGDVLTVINTPL